MLFKINQFKLVQHSSCIFRYFTQSLVHRQKPELSFMEELEQAVEERSQKLKSDKQERWKAKKERYDGRVKKRTWEHGQESEEAKQKRLEETGGERIKRRKSLILLGYSGVNYSGMQRNLGISTIEEELMKAFLKHKWINQLGFDTPQQAQFQRAARTDKGVSACRQVVSAKIAENVDIDAINKDLPDDIRIFAVKRVTKGFNSKASCDARTYSYTTPSYVFTKKDEAFEENSYRMPPERLEELNNVLKLYEGTKNYHNFTVRKEWTDPSSRRYIIKFDCKQPFVADNSEVEFVRLQVKGQSFMMHQIRKMVGLAVAIMKGYVEPFTITHAMEREPMNVPQAPGLGLVLENVHYERYNKRFGDDGMHEVLDFKDEDDMVEEFFCKKILNTITETEVAEKPMLAWTKGLKHHSFTADSNAEEGSKEDSGNTSD